MFPLKHVFVWRSFSINTFIIEEGKVSFFRLKLAYINSRKIVHIHISFFVFALLKVFKEII